MKINNPNRFTNSEYWIMGNGDAIAIEDMETNHLINTLRMFREKPNRTMSMLINDAEQLGSFFINDKYVLNRITSMSEAELIDYAMDSNLANAMIEELEKRGVNINCISDVKNGAIVDLPR